LIALNLGFRSENTVDAIAKVVCRDLATVQHWLAQFKKGGFDAVLERNYVEHGRPSGCAEEIKTYLLEGLEATRWNTVNQVKEELNAILLSALNTRPFGDG
jgi:transposase